MIERVDIVIVGAGPAGLRAAQVLAEAGREVLVLERNHKVGPKVCGGGLTAKAVRELTLLGLPPDLGLDSVPYVSFHGADRLPIDNQAASVRTIARERLGQWQVAMARRAGAGVRTGAVVTAIDTGAHRVTIDGRVVAYQHLIGADGSASQVRRALGLPITRAYFAGEFQVASSCTQPFCVAMDSDALAGGYFWVFPHTEYVSIGAGAPVALVRPPVVRRRLEAFAASLGIRQLPAFEAATIETRFAGFNFAGGHHLVGDAAGVASPVTGEGIYAALVTGEEVARRILEPAFPMAKTRAWLRIKRAHDYVARAWMSRRIRGVSLSVIEAALRQSWGRAAVTTFFLGG